MRRYFSYFYSNQKDLIIGMRTAGWSTRHITSQVDHSRCTVGTCWGQSTLDGTHVRHTGSGVTRNTTRREDRRILRQVLVDPPVIHSTIQSNVEFPVVPQTISRQFAQANLRSKCFFRVLPYTEASVTPSTVLPSHRDMKYHRLAKRDV